MKKTFDLVVLGVGMAAVAAANKCASAGWSVAVVDELPYGGTCALRGCDPKKMLRRGAEIIDAARLLHGKGIETAGLRIDWQQLVAFKRTFTDKVPIKIEAKLRDKGVATFHGPARFLDETMVEIGDATRLHGRNILIATGAKPRPLDVPGAEHLIDSTAFMELEKLPKRILFVGGGYIAFEFAHIAARVGSDVQIIDRGHRPLKAFDPDLVDKLVQRSRSASMYTLTPVSSQSKKATKAASSQRRRSGASYSGRSTWWFMAPEESPPLTTSIWPMPVLMPAGPGSPSPSISKASRTRPSMRPAMPPTRQERRWTPVAVFEGKVAASNMLKGNTSTPEYRGVPSVVFTIPELARVGMLESEAKDQGRDVRVEFNDTSGWYSNLRVGERCAATKVIIDNKTDEVLGAHLLGPEYAELINFLGLAMRLGLKTSDLKKMVSAYPSVGSDLGSML